MARYKHTDVEDGQGIFLSVNLKEQLLPGSFEHMLDELIGGKIDVTAFDNNYRNNDTGATAIPPASLMKLIIYGYSKGKNSSRGLWELGKTNIIAKALTGDMEPHWTTIADFISHNGERFKEVFAKALAYCAELGLVGGQTFATDGLRLPSNASLDMTGTAEELGKRLKLYRRMAENHIKKHQRKDAAGETGKEPERHFQEQQERLSRKTENLSRFLETTEKRESRHGKEIKSNVTDNESAMIHTSKGYIQGYIGMAVSDQKEQVIVCADAVGSANESEHFPQMLEETLGNIKECGVKTSPNKKPVFLCDKNYFSEENLKACAEHGVDAIMPDSQYKRRLGRNKYMAEDFTFHEKEDCYECPAGKKLEFKRTGKIKNVEGRIYRGNPKDCGQCPARDKCMGKRKEPPKKLWPRTLFIQKADEKPLCKAMRVKNNTVESQDLYAYRMQIIEPVFANIVCCKGLDRFTLRGAVKVNGQWQLYCIVHNLGKCLKSYNRARGYG